MSSWHRCGRFPCQASQSRFRSRKFYSSWICGKLMRACRLAACRCVLHTDKASVCTCRPGTIIVRVLVTSICGSDLCGRCCATTAAGAWRGYTDPPGGDLSVPGGTGHEVMGEVAEVVEPSSLSVGDRVLVFATGYVKAVPTARRAYIAVRNA